MATVRVSAGFRPNKMLPSMCKGREECVLRVRVVCLCVSVCVCVFGNRQGRGAGELPQGIKRRTFTREGRKRGTEDAPLNQHCPALRAHNGLGALMPVHIYTQK